MPGVNPLVGLSVPLRSLKPKMMHLIGSEGKGINTNIFRY
jgi:hypothetical protein